MKFTKLFFTILLAVIITLAGYFNSENNLLQHYSGLEFISKVASIPYYIFVLVSFGLLAFTEMTGFIVLNIFGWSVILFLVLRKIENIKIFFLIVTGLIILTSLFLLYSYNSFNDYKNNRIVYCLDGTLQRESYNMTSAYKCLDSRIFELLYKDDNSRTLIDLNGSKFEEAVTFCKSLPEMKVNMSNHWSTILLNQSNNSNDFCFYSLGFRVLKEEFIKVPNSSDKHLTSIINTTCSYIKSDISRCNLFFTENLNNKQYFWK